MADPARILQEIETLPPPKRQEVFDFIRFLKIKEAAAHGIGEITLASEAVLARDWLSPEEETAWAYLSLREAILTPPEAGSSFRGKEPGGLGEIRHRFPRPVLAYPVYGESPRLLPAEGAPRLGRGEDGIAERRSFCLTFSN